MEVFEKCHPGPVKFTTYNYVVGSCCDQWAETEVTAYCSCGKEIGCSSNLDLYGVFTSPELEAKLTFKKRPPPTPPEPLGRNPKEDSELINQQLQRIRSRK